MTKGGTACNGNLNYECQTGAILGKGEDIFSVSTRRKWVSVFVFWIRRVMMAM